MFFFTYVPLYSVSNETNYVHATCWCIYFNFSTCFGQLCANHQANLLYLCDTGIFHSVCVAVWSALLLGIFISTSLYVSGNYVPIIRRTYCLIPTSRSDSHPYRVKNTSVA